MQPIAALAHGLLGRHDAGTVWARGREDVTRGVLRDRVVELARTFALHGIRPGAMVLVRMRPSLTTFWAVIALWSRGATIVVVDPHLSSAEDTWIADFYRPGFLVRSSGFGSILTEFDDECEVVVGFGSSGPAGHGGRYALARLGPGPSAIAFTPAALDAELRRLAGIEGMPKAGERVLLLDAAVAGPVFVAGVLHSSWVGATLVLPWRRSVGPLFDTVDPSVDVVVGDPAALARLVALGADGLLPALRSAVAVGGSLRWDLRARFEERFEVNVQMADPLSPAEPPLGIPE